MTTKFERWKPEKKKKAVYETKSLLLHFAKKCYVNEAPPPHETILHGYEGDFVPRFLKTFKQALNNFENTVTLSKTFSN